MVGAFINGFKVTGRTFSGGALDWLTPFNLFCGLGLVIAYALLGASWLVMKSGEPLQGKMRAAAKKLLLALLVVMGVISCGRRSPTVRLPIAGSACRTCSSSRRCRCW